MAEDDIYGNKKRYEKFVTSLDELTTLPKEKNKKGGTRKYYCKNPKNILYFKKLHKIFESRDTSYIRRFRVFRTLLMIAHATNKDFLECERKFLIHI